VRRKRAGDGMVGGFVEYRPPGKFLPGLGDLGIKSKEKNLLIPKSWPNIAGKIFFG
jgi:hypothetical protein